MFYFSARNNAYRSRPDIIYRSSNTLEYVWNGRENYSIQSKFVKKKNSFKPVFYGEHNHANILIVVVW